MTTRLCSTQRSNAHQQSRDTPTHCTGARTNPTNHIFPERCQKCVLTGFDKRVVLQKYANCKSTGDFKTARFRKIRTCWRDVRCDSLAKPLPKFGSKLALLTCGHVDRLAGHGLQRSQTKARRAWVTEITDEATMTTRLFSTQRSNAHQQSRDTPTRARAAMNSATSMRPSRPQPRLESFAPCRT
jgi:hypothetical protein